MQDLDPRACPGAIVTAELLAGLPLRATLKVRMGRLAREIRVTQDGLDAVIWEGLRVVTSVSLIRPEWANPRLAPYEIINQ